MKKFDFKKILPYLAAIVIFVVITLAYFSPLLEGKKMLQSDIVHFKGMSKEISDYRARTGQEPLWTNSMFGGMPAYQISTLYKGNLLSTLDSVITLGLPHPANLVFLYFLGFFILLLVMKVDPWLSLAGSVAFALSSYFFVIIEAGHNSQAHAIGYMAPVMAGIILTMNRKYFWGGIMTAIFLSLEVWSNHPQITYYLAMIVLVYGLFQLIQAIREKWTLSFMKSVGILVIALAFGVLTNLTTLWATWEYGKYTIRGKSELTTKKENRTSGLDKDYATQWSYGKAETMTLLIPNFFGGSSNAAVDQNSALIKVLKEKGYPDEALEQLARPVASHIYWGALPFTSGPVYAGAAIIFLFILGLLIVKGPLKWWLLVTTILSLILAWGHNFMAVTDFFLEYVPGYNKFRAVSMILIIAEFTIPLLGILSLKEIVDHPDDRKKHFRSFRIAFIITAGIALFFALMPGVLDFSINDPASLKEQIASYYQRMLSRAVPPEQVSSIAGQLTDTLMPALMDERRHLLQADAFRSLLFIVLAGGLVLALVYRKTKKEYIFLGLALLCAVDMFWVNKRYSNNDSFKSGNEVANPYEPSEADNQILMDTSPDYRVLNLTVGPWYDASTSYFHKSIGGYHGAKLRRYQELIETGIQKDIETFAKSMKTDSTPVLNMLNTKYMILPGREGGSAAFTNMNALGNAWFVDSVHLVANADEEIKAVQSFEPARVAIVDKVFSDMLGGINPDKDSSDMIRLEKYEPNALSYTTHAARQGVAVFSEIYYPKGWNAYIDGKPAPHFRANYVLRAMILPAGDHKVDFKFEPKVYSTGEAVSRFSSILLIVITIALGTTELMKILKKRS